MSVAIVHDYLTQRGGAERVVLSMLKAFPGATLYTSLFEPGKTFPEFGTAPVRPMALNRLAPLRRHHRLALPALASAFSSLQVDADVTICSSSGWAHGAQVSGRKVVYCYSPARWLYDAERYAEGWRTAGAVLGALRPRLVRWDRKAAASADRYVTLSEAVRRRIKATYGLDAEVLPPPPAIDPTGPRHQVGGLEPGFFLCVSRLLPYKNISAVTAAFAELPKQRLVVVGTGPERARLQRRAPSNVVFLGTASEARLRWLYESCRGVVAASHEDYGLTPLEGALFGRPCAVLRSGGFLDTVVDGETGLFFDAPEPEAIARTVGRLTRHDWQDSVIRAHVASFDEEHFIRKIREIVSQVADPNPPGQLVDEAVREGGIGGPLESDSTTVSTLTATDSPEAEG